MRGAFLANVNCRILVLPHRPPSALCPRTAGDSQSTPRPPAAGDNDRWSLPPAQHSYLIIYKPQTQGKTCRF